jgi:hypothetical protein
MIEWITWAHSKKADFKQITHKLLLHSDGADAKVIAEEISSHHVARLNQKKYLGVDDWVAGTTPRKKD